MFCFVVLPFECLGLVLLCSLLIVCNGFDLFEFTLICLLCYVLVFRVC